MWRIIAIIVYTLLNPWASFAGAEINIDTAYDNRVLNYPHRLFIANPQNSYIAPTSTQNIRDFLKTLEPVSSTRLVGASSYWIYVVIDNQQAMRHWVFSVLDSHVSDIHIHRYDAKGVKVEAESSRMGLLNVHYGRVFTLPDDKSIQLLINVKGNYFSGSPVFKLQGKNEYIAEYIFLNGVLFACMGAILILAFYHLSLGSWARDKSSLYFSAFLFSTLMSWLFSYQIVNYFSEYLRFNFIYTFLFTSFAFNALYFIDFLELKVKYKNLTFIARFFALSAFLSALSTFFLSVVQVVNISIVLFTSWVLLALWVGFYRLMEGYQPARLFTLAFVIIFLASLIIIFPFFFEEVKVESQFTLTLIGHTLGSLLLALAAANRINILQVQKEVALRHAVSTKAWAVKTEHNSNEILKKSLAIAARESQRKSDFLRLVSHELRTPLYSIIASIDQWNGLNNAFDRRDLLHFVGYGAARLRMQVDNLVLLAETDSNDVKVNNIDFELRPVLTSLCENVKGLLGESVVFNFLCEDNVPRFLKGDRYLLENMLRTVLDNACKYTEQGEIGFHIQWSEGALDILITDTGYGMTREQERLMFNEFVQVSRGLDRQSEGLGIGLTVCYRLSEILGTDFSIKSVLGEGTQVLIRQPIEDVSGGCYLIKPSVVKSLNVLIVEDNVVNAHILKRLVEFEGGVATIAESGQEALEILDQHIFDIVLMDIQMPIMDGITATRWIRQRGITIPIVAVTANSDADIRSRCFEVGMNDFLVKPLRRAEVARVLTARMTSTHP